MHDGVDWLGQEAPQQPDLIMLSLKESISQGIRSFVRSEPLLSTNAKGLQLAGPRAHDKAFEVLIHALQTAFESIEAKWMWPPPEITLGNALDGWYSSERYESIIDTIRKMYSGLNRFGMQYLSSMTVRATMDSVIDRDLTIVIPASQNERMSELMHLENIPSVSRQNSLSEENVREPFQTSAVNRPISHNPGESKGALKRKVASLEEELKLEKLLSKELVSNCMDEASPLSRELFRPVRRNAAKKLKQEKAHSGSVHKMEAQVADERLAASSFLSRLKKIGRSFF